MTGYKLEAVTIVLETHCGQCAGTLALPTPGLAVIMTADQHERLCLQRHGQHERPGDNLCQEQNMQPLILVFDLLVHLSSTH